MMITSAILVLSTLIHAAPIPKNEPEQRILLVKNAPQPAELILMNPSGKIIKRFEPKGIDGFIYSVRLYNSASKAIVLRYEPPEASTIGGDRTWSHTSIYLIDLEKTNEPAKLIFKDLASMDHVSLLPNNQGIIFSDLDEKEANATKKGDLTPYRNWIFHFESGKKEQLKLPKGHVVADLSTDGKTLLTCTDYNADIIEDFKKRRCYLTSLDTMQPKLISDSSFYGLRFSPDGKWIFVNQLTKLETGTLNDLTHYLMNLNTKETHQLRIPNTTAPLSR